MNLEKKRKQKTEIFIDFERGKITYKNFIFLMN